MTTELKNKKVIVRKKQFCEWCDEEIKAGDPAQYRAYIFDGDFISAWQHPECYAAMNRSDRHAPEEGWLRGDNLRGEAA